MDNNENPGGKTAPLPQETSGNIPDKRKIIKNQLKLLLILTAIYSLIAHQAQKLDSSDITAKQPAPDGKDKPGFTRNTSFLFAKD